MLFLLALTASVMSCNSAADGEVDYGEMRFLKDLPDGRKAFLRRSIEVDNGFDTVIVETFKVGNDSSGVRDSIVETVQPFNKPPVPTVNSVSSHRKNLLLESTFDQPTLAEALKGWSDEQHDEKALWSRTLNNKTLQFELRSTDAITSGSVRTEITHEVEGEQWYGGRVYLKDWAPDTGGESIWQVHGTTQDCPPLGIVIYGTDISLMQCPSDAISTTYTLIGNTNEWSNKWVDIVIHIKWDTKPTGFIEAWVNGEKKADKKNIITAIEPVYMKLGMNKWSWAPGGGASTQRKRVFQWDDFRIGNEKATYDDVKP